MIICPTFWARVTSGAGVGVESARESRLWGSVAGMPLPADRVGAGVAATGVGAESGAQAASRAKARADEPVWRKKRRRERVRGMSRSNG